MTNDLLLTRIEKFERTVATSFCVVPILFAAQCIAAAFSCPVFEAMFADFGSKLPAPTEFVLHTWPWWAGGAVVLPTIALAFARKGKAGSAVVFATVSGLVMFVVAQLITLALFLPILQLGSVAAGIK